MTDVKPELATGRDNLATFPQRGDRTLGKLLVEAGKLKFQDVEAIERCQKERNLRFGEAAVQLGLVQETDIVQMLARQFDYPYLQAGEGGFCPDLIAAYQPFGQEVEGFRKLRSQLALRWFMQEDRKALSVMGLNEGDGCSYIASNLAVVFSQLGEKTLLVDTNLRTPRQNQIFNLDQRFGLSDILAGRYGIEAICKVPEFVDLSVLPAGTVPPNPQELLGRPGFGALLRDLSRIYDVVILDTAPAMLYGDAQNVAAETKSALMVVRRHETRMSDLASLQRDLTNAHVEIIGAVFSTI